jgi:cytochrome b
MPMNKINLFIDIGIFGVFLIAANPNLTGLPLHEWLGVALAGTLVVHLLLHWRWITTVTLHFFRQLFHDSRLQYVVDLLLFISFTTVMMSGLMISRVVLPFLGIALTRNPAWLPLHDLSANATLALIAVHTALHWDWVVKTFKRYLVDPVTGWLHGKRLPGSTQIKVEK